MQSAEDARRVKELGAGDARVFVSGNLKYDLPSAPPFADAERLRAAAAGRPIVVAGSTGEGEEALVIEAWQPLDPRPFLVLAPRRPERFDGVATLAQDPPGRRSSGAAPAAGRRQARPVPARHDRRPRLQLHPEATLAFIGGSLIARGDNPIEAWAAGVPAIAGPHMENFRDVAAAGEDRGILTRVEDAAGLGRAIAAGLAAPEDRRRRAADAARFVEENRGAADRTAAAVLALLPGSSATGARRVILSPFAALYGKALSLRAGWYASGRLESRPLPGRRSRWAT